MSFLADRDHIVVDGFPWRLVRCTSDTALGETRNIGRCASSQQQIVLATDIPVPTQIETVLHELTHAWLLRRASIKRSDAVEEAVCDAVSCGLVALMREDPLFVLECLEAAIATAAPRPDVGVTGEESPSPQQRRRNPHHARQRTRKPGHRNR